MVETKKIDEANLDKTIFNKNIEDFENIKDFYSWKLKDFERKIVLELYFQKIYQYYKSWKIDIKTITNYKKIQEIFENIDKKVGPEVKTKIFPSIDFSKSKKYEKQILELSKKYKDKTERLALLLAIHDFLKQNLKYPFFLWFSILHSKKTYNNKMLKMWITDKDIIFLKNIIKNENFEKDKYLEKFISLLNQKDKNQIKHFLINNFNKFNKSNQAKLLEIFWNNYKNNDWNFLYSYLWDVKIEDIIEKYKIWDCTHFALIWKYFFNKLYTWKETKMLYLANPILKHAYNILILNTKEEMEFIYVDFLENKDELLGDYWYHEFDILTK